MTDFKKFTVAAIFSNHMVLQRNKFIAVFGQAEKGTLITASLFNDKNELLCSNKRKTNR